MQDKVNRNDPCPCGSGKKYKHCCGRPKPMAQVLYVHPAKQDVDFYAERLADAESNLGRPYGLIPLGLPALVNVLRAEGITVKGVIYPLEKQLNPAFDLRRWLLGHKGARLVLIDMHWYEHTYGAISVAEVCKEVLPEALTVLGGLSASGFARDILENFTAVDFVIRGDAELPLLQLAQFLLKTGEVPDGGEFGLREIPNLSYREQDTIVENPRTYCALSEDLDRLNFADVDFLDHFDAYLVHEYIVSDLDAARNALNSGTPYHGRWVCTARGCKYECSYCGGCKSAHRILAGRDGIVPRSPEKVVEEIAHLAANNVIQISLSYDIAELGDKYWRSLFSLLRKRGIKIGLYNELFQLPPDGFIKRFARCVDMEHSCLALSPLSGSERVRRLNGKHFSDAQLFNILDYLNLYSVPILVYFSLNLPGENEQTLEETISLAKRIYDMYPHSLLKILNSCHTIDPLSPMQQHPDKYGIKASMNTFMDFYDYCRETQLSGPGAVTGEWRGFTEMEPTRSLEKMARAWDAERQGREESWWPIPPSW